jgi:hypothetical protein
LPPNREKNFQANSPPNKPKINQNLPPNQVKISPNQQPSKQTKIVNFGLETNHLATLDLMYYSITSGKPYLNTLLAVNLDWAYIIRF